MTGRVGKPTGLSQQAAEPKVSALRASIPRAKREDISSRHISRKATGRAFPVYEKAGCARQILADALGITAEQAQHGLVALVKGGFGIAPRNPTNGMLVAYLEALTPPTGHEQVVTAIGKARVRWQAMLQQGTERSLSRKVFSATGRLIPASGIEGSAQDAQRLDPEGKSPAPKADAR